MILVINTSGNGLEFVLDGYHKSVEVEKQSVALPAETEKFLTECGASWSDLTAIGVVVGPAVLPASAWGLHMPKV
jgi:tRNA A37 threonylcarbamoyladenosine modification protein TsaB